MAGIGLAIIHIDRIEFTEHGQRSIGSDGLLEGFMALLLRELSDVLIPEFDQEALFEGSDTTGCLFIVFVTPCEHSDQGADFFLAHNSLCRRRRRFPTKARIMSSVCSKVFPFTDRTKEPQSSIQVLPTLLLALQNTL